MASGKVHAQDSQFLAIPAGLIAAFALNATGGMSQESILAVGMGTAIGCWLTLAINPDLDVSGLTRSEYKVLKYVGPLGWLWIAFWLPYSLIFAHRSPVTHLPLLSTLGRLLYLFLPLLPFSLLSPALRADGGELRFWPTLLLHDLSAIGASLIVWQYALHLLTIWPLLLGLGLGLVVGDTAHWFRDGMPHLLPSRRGRRRFRSSLTLPERSRRQR